MRLRLRLAGEDIVSSLETGPCGGIDHKNDTIHDFLFKAAMAGPAPREAGVTSSQRTGRRSAPRAHAIPSMTGDIQRAADHGTAGGRLGVDVGDLPPAGFGLVMAT